MSIDIDIDPDIKHRIKSHGKRDILYINVGLTFISKALHTTTTLFNGENRLGVRSMAQSPPKEVLPTL